MTNKALDTVNSRVSSTGKVRCATMFADAFGKFLCHENHPPLDCL